MPEEKSESESEKKKITLKFQVKLKLRRVKAKEVVFLNSEAATKNRFVKLLELKMGRNTDERKPD